MSSLTVNSLELGKKSTIPIGCSVISLVEVKVSAAKLGDDVEADPKFMVSFSLGDRRNPFNFRKSRKWALTLLSSYFAFLVGVSPTAFNSGTPSMARDLNCTTFEAASLGLTIYFLGYAVVPLVTSAFSEEFGRLPVYYVSVVGLLLSHAMTALAKDIQVVLFSRFLQGVFGSTITVAAGTITDIWSSEERGFALSFYSLWGFVGSGCGALAGGWIETNPKLEWRWIQWISLMVTGLYLMLLIPVLTETRPSVILAKLARDLRKKNSDHRYQPLLPESERHRTLRQMLYISCTRPIYLLFSEPIVFAFSLWLGFAWGILYIMIDSIPRIFKSLHNFNDGEVGSVYMAVAVGSLLGFCSNLYQEKLYQRNVEKRGPQARLYLVCFAAFLLPASMFTFAWCSLKSLPWAPLAVALIIFNWAVFTMYLAIYTYLSDCYGIYASSAIAAQSFFRGTTATLFPLFSDKVFDNLGYRWANTLFACIGLALSPVPIILFFYGPKLLARSRVFQRLQSPQKSDSRPIRLSLHNK